MFSNSNIVRNGLISCGFALLSVATCAASTITIGAFSDDQEVETLNGGANPKQASSNGSSPNDIGAQREFIVRRLGAGTGNLSMDSNLSNEGWLNLALPNTNSAQALVTWDGDGPGIDTGIFTPDIPAATDAAKRGQPDTFLLGDIDLTDGGSNSRLSFWASSDQPGTQVTFRVYTGPGVYATATFNLAASGSTLQYYFLPFNLFTATGNTVPNIIEHANAITLQIFAPTAATDVGIDFIGANVPEPGTFVMFSGMLAGLALWSRRRRAN